MLCTCRLSKHHRDTFASSLTTTTRSLLLLAEFLTRVTVYFIPARTVETQLGHLRLPRPRQRRQASKPRRTFLLSMRAVDVRLPKRLSTGGGTPTTNCRRNSEFGSPKLSRRSCGIRLDHLDYGLLGMDGSSFPSCWSLNFFENFPERP